jgi:hypothetical protein
MDLVELEAQSASSVGVFFPMASCGKLAAGSTGAFVANVGRRCFAADGVLAGYCAVATRRVCRRRQSRKN